MATSRIKPPPLVTKLRRNVEPKPTVGAVDPTNQDQPLVNKTRADFRSEEFVRVIRQKGYFCIWRKAVACPCMSQETQRALLNCKSCGGSGYLYIDPVLLQAVMTRFDKKTNIYETPGVTQGGTAKATVEPQYRLGFRDSLELRDSVITYNEHLTKGDRRGPRSKLPENTDAARYRIVRVIVMMWKDSEGQIDRLEENVDFRVNDDGHIVWLPKGARVPDGTTVSINYEMRPVYIVTSHSNVLRSTLTLFKKKAPTVEALPMQVEVMLDFLTQDIESPAPVTMDG